MKRNKWMDDEELVDDWRSGWTGEEGQYVRSLMDRFVSLGAK